jgi:uncharacterized glyoxalase superfamily metalloenzyme YdcJ
MSHYLSPDQIRSAFSQAMSEMYRIEVPAYGALLDIVADTNKLSATKASYSSLKNHDINDDQRLSIERHGAIRLGTDQELSTIRRLFSVMGMYPVGYYDLSSAGVPVHATAFRPLQQASLQINPFRVFTSLLRLELIDHSELRESAKKVLSQRHIFTPYCLEIIEQFETDGRLADSAAQDFVTEALKTFRWQNEATVDHATYLQLRAAHPLIADIVCFKGPHINHLTPRVMDIDAAQAEMLRRQMKAKSSIEGPPRRKVPILLRQTSFIALEEPITFLGTENTQGSHTARFGEIEQRGSALTPKGRNLYDRLLLQARTVSNDSGNVVAKPSYADALEQSFNAFPDDIATLRQERLAYFKYTVNLNKLQGVKIFDLRADVDALVASGILDYEPIVYEDFLPVSAAGIFQSNLAGDAQQSYQIESSQAVFEKALGVSIQNEFNLYQETEAVSLDACFKTLGFHPNASY